MSASFGIDHPLIATRDVAGLRNRLISLGFTMTPIGRHPWGTSTSLAMFALAAMSTAICRPARAWR